MADKSTKRGRPPAEGGIAEKAVTLTLPLEMLDEIERAAAAQMRTRTNMIRVILHTGVQALSEERAHAEELGLIAPPVGKFSATRG